MCSYIDKNPQQVIYKLSNTWFFKIQIMLSFTIKTT